MCKLLSEAAAAGMNWAESYGQVDSGSPCLQSLLQDAVWHRHWAKITVRLGVKKLFLQGVNRTLNKYNTNSLRQKMLHDTVQSSSISLPCNPALAPPEF